VWDPSRSYIKINSYPSPRDLTGAPHPSIQVVLFAPRPVLIKVVGSQVVSTVDHTDEAALVLPLVY
jgi:hypothetical protein